MRAHVVAALILSVCLSFSPLAASEEGLAPRRVRVMVPVCETLPFDVADLIDVLAAELQGQEINLVNGGDVELAEEAEARLVIDVPGCATDSGVRVRVEALATGSAVERLLRLESDRGQERVVALAVAELLDRSWEALVGAPETTPDAAPVSTTPEREDDPSPTATEDDDLSPAERQALLDIIERRERQRRSRPLPEAGVLVDIQLDGRIVPTMGTGFLGLVGGVSLPLGRDWLRIELDVGAWYGLGTDLLGHIDLVAVTGAAALLFGGRRGGRIAALGPRLEAGWCLAQGRPFPDSVAEGGSISSAVVVISAEATIRFSLSRRSWLLIDGALGYAVVGPEGTADGRVAAGIEGVVVSLGLGLSFR